jgi:parallel beta-helix repeat protein
MSMLKSVFVIVLILFLTAFAIRIGVEPFNTKKANATAPSKCGCARARPCPYNTDVLSIDPAKPQQAGHTSTKDSHSPYLNDNPVSDSPSQIEFSADQCNQFCDCLTEASMPNGWTGKQSSIGFWENCWPCTLLRWPLSDLPGDIIVTGATIKLYCDSHWGNISGRLFFAPVTSNWNSAVTYSTRPTIDESQAIEVPWPNRGQWFEIDVTSIIEQWAEGILSNYGIEAYATGTTHTGGIDIRTPGWSDPQYHPKLTITYNQTSNSNKTINYFDQEPPGMSPVIFAQDIISLPDRDEAQCIFSPDGNECLLSVTPTGDWAIADILYFQQIDGQWTEQLTAPFSNVGSCNIHSTFSADGQKVFFSSNRDFPGQFDTDIWVTERTEQGWTEPMRLPTPMSSLAAEWSPSITNDGTLYFSSYRDGGVGRSGYNPDIWRAIPTNGQYTRVENIGAPVNAGSYDAWNVFIARDESYLITMEDRPGTGADLYISFREADNSWTVPESLGLEINTSDNEQGPFVSPDGKYLFFGRNQPGHTGDIYWVDIHAIPGFEEAPNGPATNLTTGKKYLYIQGAINAAMDNDEIVVVPGIYEESIIFGGKNITLRSTEPNDPATVAATIIKGGNHGVTFSGGQDANCILAGFTITDANNGIFCTDASPIIVNCIITDNNGAGIKLHNGSNPTIANCEITCNTGAGVGMLVEERGRYIIYNNPIITNCVIAENLQQGISGGKPTIINCTIAANTGPGISSYQPTVTNSIIYYNNLSSDSIQIESNSATVTYTDVQGGWPGQGNINTDPLFVDVYNGDYHLLAGSPCIDTGDPNSDFTLEPEPNGQCINMGAYGGTIEACKS